MEYDLQDPTDLAILRSNYDNVSASEWQACLNFTIQSEHKKAFSFEDRGCLMRMEQKAGSRHRPADKDIRWGLRLAEKIDFFKSQTQTSTETAELMKRNLFNNRMRHVTFRVAWHDNKWNGTVCKDPVTNRYCSGFNSMLSERLRKRKYENIDQEKANKGQQVNQKYLPPCFWSLNIFGESDIPVEHDNPAEPRLDHIKETLPAHSMFSWPFSVAFTRRPEQIKSDGAYPKNLEEVRIPYFQSKIHDRKSVAFMYAKYSNPLTEEEQQYLVIGCGLITEKGDYNNFEPLNIIEEKRNNPRKPKNKYFPQMNWAIRYSFDPDTLVRMPYHEYLDDAKKPGIDEDAKEKLLNKIKVAITEPELNHCFKYVAMDVDDDEAIFILCKMRKQLIDCRNDAIVPVEEMQERIEKVDNLLRHCWRKRGYFPGFITICKQLLNWDKVDFPLDDFWETLEQNEGDAYIDKFLELMENPAEDKRYKKYSSILFDAKETYQQNYGLNDEQFLQLCLLNLTEFQFKRLLSGKLHLSGDWKKTIDDEKPSHTVLEICDNPYLLFEEYHAYDTLLDGVTGEELDYPIELFKIDIAYFPDRRAEMEKLSLQRTIANNDKRRIRGLVIRHLRTLENTGHCFADADEIQQAIKEYPLFYNLDTEYILPSSFFEHLTSAYINHFEETGKLKVVPANDTKYFYLSEVFEAEQFVGNIISRLAQKSIDGDDYRALEDYIEKSCVALRRDLKDAFEEETFREERKKLYENIYRKKLFLLTGGAGSGKSFELLNIISNLQKSGQKCLLLAPTGKATLRLKSEKQFSNIEAFTIDKLLTDLKSGHMSIGTLLEYNNVVIDEMSMVDLMKLNRLLHCFNISLPSFKRLILVGDPHQLPAIGYGKLLSDILYFLRTHAEYKDCYIELQTNCRQELATSDLPEFSEGYIKDGELENPLKMRVMTGIGEVSSGFKVRFWETESQLFDLLEKEFESIDTVSKLKGSKPEKLNQLFGLTKNGDLTSNCNLENFQILTPYKSEFFGSAPLNDYIQANFKDGEMKLLDDHFKNSDKIIRTKNYYKKENLVLSNGSIGLINDNGSQQVIFPAELKEPISIYGEEGIRSSDREFFDLAYAITVHKSQGSGFNHTFFILPKKPGLLSKELVYTALTRCRKSTTLLVQGNANTPFDKSVLGKARIRSYTESRKTSLLLDKPFRYFNLEADGNIIESRVELLIFQALKHAKEKLGDNGISILYEVPPVIDGNQLPIKTDFTILTSTGTWYWEHLGKLHSKKYFKTWKDIKRPTYEKYMAIDRLITTDELNGINPTKIDEIVQKIVENRVETEDPNNRYSHHHFSLK